MYLCVSGIEFPSFRDLGILIWTCYDRVLIFIFHSLPLQKYLVSQLL